ncbi:MAG: cupin domain-containing protein [Sphingomonas sp.]|nr:cupin domain-containing protein [Sphingomonas sp.]
MRRLVLVATVALLAGSEAQTGAKVGLSWGPAPNSLPRGAKIAVVSGDPARAGPFVIRLRFPPGYSVPPHRHPSDEHVTVVNGALTLGMGTVMNDGRRTVLGRGDSIVAPAGMNHYASTTQGATVQISARGPFQIVYVNRGDDPRL